MKANAMHLCIKNPEPCNKRFVYAARINSIKELLVSPLTYWAGQWVNHLLTANNWITYIVMDLFREASKPLGTCQGKYQSNT